MDSDEISPIQNAPTQPWVVSRGSSQYRESVLPVNGFPFWRYGGRETVLWLWWELLYLEIRHYIAMGPRTIISACVRSRIHPAHYGPVTGITNHETCSRTQTSTNVPREINAIVCIRPILLDKLSVLYQNICYASAFRRRRHYVFGLSVRPSVRPKPEIPSFDLYIGPLVHPTNRYRFTACPSVRPSICPSVRLSVRPSVRRGFRAFAGDCMEGLAWNFTCWCILTIFRID